MTTKEIAKRIRAELKEAGYKSRDWSVVSDLYGVNITSKNKDHSLSDLTKAEKISIKFEKIDRCEVSGEILSGGNTYISVMNHKNQSTNWTHQFNELKNNLINISVN